MIDIVIPVLNEEEILIEREAYFRTFSKKARLIFVDGGSSDKTADMAQRFGRLISSKRGRGLQKNAGAGYATADTILFLHVDSLISEEALNDIEQIVKNGAVGGCLTMKIDDGRFMFKVYEWIINGRARTRGIIDGDLGLFLKRDIFREIGGFDNLEMMEDIGICYKLRGKGRLKISSHPICVSSRKWKAQGFLKTFLQYTSAYVRFWTGCLKTAKP